MTLKNPYLPPLAPSLPDALFCKECEAMSAHDCKCDPTPWCSICGAMRAADCKCPPDADFEEDVQRLREEAK